jgi:hypothetical protein
LAQVGRDLDGSPLGQIEQDGNDLCSCCAALAVEDGAGQRQRRATDPQDAGSDPRAP